MADERLQDLVLRLEEFGERIDAKVDELRKQGVLHGAEREAAADWKLRQIKIAEWARGDAKPMGELAADIAALKLTFERWLARIDKSSETSTQL